MKKVDELEKGNNFLKCKVVLRIPVIHEGLSILDGRDPLGELRYAVADELQQAIKDKGWKCLDVGEMVYCDRSGKASTNLCDKKIMS